MEKKHAVLPGEFLSTEEEFGPGKNAFDSEGSIYSKVAGVAETNSKMKEIGVKPFSEIIQLRPGSIVLARVSLVKENSAIVDLCAEAGSEERVVLAPSTAMIPVRNVSQEYVENLKDYFKVGDLIKAKVTRILPEGSIDLATNEPDLGIIKAFCSRCRQPMHLFGTMLRCLACGASEKRKIAKEYYIR
jgi:exosome complex component CSL4